MLYYFFRVRDESRREGRRMIQQSFDGTIADFTSKDRAKRYRYAVSTR
jgi:hypothetical protein